jgi:hypothetical protein
MHQLHMVFAYFGPETVMPVTSIVATVAAVILMYGKSLFRLVAGWIRRASFRRRHGGAATGPHFRLGQRRRKMSKAVAAGRARRSSE